MSFDKDVEKIDSEKRGSVTGASEDESHAIAAETFEVGDSLYARLQRFAGKWNIEQRGIERVPESEKTDTKLYKAGTMWLAANLVVSSFAIGVLGPHIFALGWRSSWLTILFFNLLSITPVCFFSTFGPEFGLRQMILSRFFFGAHLVRFIAFLNCLACIGWSSVNVIVGAQLIHTVNHSVPEYAGILIIAFCTFIITCFGYKVVHYYEFYSWIPCFIVFLITVIQFGRSGVFTAMPDGSGKETAGSILSFGGAIYGFGTGWCSYAADYTVYQPKSANKYLVFFYTWAGLIFPLLFTEILGAAIYMGTYSSEVYKTGYETGKIGGLFGAVLVTNSLGNFGNFCLIILALSIIGNNCPNIYSIGLSVQVLSTKLQRVPRFVWTFIATCCYIAIAIPGATHFETVLENFMLLIAYWLGIYEGISLTEHFIFRRGFKGYEVSHYDQPDKLPVGIAAGIAFCAGIGGAVLGMSQVYWMGPIARLCGGEFGGDVGFELAFGFAAVTYVALRPLEKARFGR
ncbi:purine-cytosine permease [Orbilia oligospora]|uniref:Purine-cytosine permease n=1 Tax=Orbilia oligospora TaxID=2813651 RepID=A0A7C8KBM8_ORBOL|nr:purine-cytosine permease [Orbilia oligospora]KAF3205337.1 purine-cytosine permease [Orbilia oligospora]KAF3207962.1 purine-cytosine permease [Orbilia oligospora]